MSNYDYIGKHPITKEPLSWMYYDDYKLSNFNKNEIYDYNNILNYE